MGWIRKAPTAVVVTMVVVCGLGTVAVVGGFVALELAGRGTDDYLAFVSFLINTVMLLVTGTGTVAAVSAARSASNTEAQTNGALSAKTEEIADAAAQRAVQRWTDGQ